MQRISNKGKGETWSFRDCDQCRSKRYTSKGNGGKRRQARASLGDDIKIINVAEFVVFEMAASGFLESEKGVCK